MKTTLCLFVFTSLITLAGFGQSTSRKRPIIQYATAYVTQPSSTKQPTIRVAYENGESEVFLLEKYSSMEDRKSGGKKISATDLDNQIAITSFINELVKRNYTLKDIEYDVSSHNTKYTLMIFEKVVMIPIE